MLKKFFVKEKRIILASVAAGFIITVCAAFYTESYSNQIQAGIADEVVRLHVLANSNSDEDQELKLKVRDGVLGAFENELAQAQSKGETRDFILSNLDRIEACAARIIEDNGRNDTVSVSLATDFFPSKLYGDVSLPAGNYEALRIEIGEAEGNNWWCVVFPPLCYVDASLSKITEESKAELKTLLSEEEYEIVTSLSSEKITPKIKFKIVEVWQKIKNK